MFLFRIARHSSRKLSWKILFSFHFIFPTASLLCRSYNTDRHRWRTRLSENHPDPTTDIPAARPGLRQMALQGAARHRRADAGLAVFRPARRSPAVAGNRLRHRRRRAAAGHAEPPTVVVEADPRRFCPAARQRYAWASTPLVFVAFILLLSLSYRGAISGQIPLISPTSAPLPDSPNGSVPAPDSVFLIPVQASAAASSCSANICRKPAHWCGERPGQLADRLAAHARLHDCSWQMGDLWKTPLDGFDVVYAFLSPAPMPALWEKARRRCLPAACSSATALPS